MYAWERDALGIDTLGEIRGSVSARMRIEIAGSSRAAWWIATLFGPDFWTHWRVGLLRPTLFGVTDAPISPPEPLVLAWPKHLYRKVALSVDPVDFIAVCPAIVAEKALAFAVAGVTPGEVASGPAEPADRWALVAPTALVDRLKLTDGASVGVRLLPASYRVDPPHQR